ncbi:MAG: hypothetical protein IPK60_08855 [Sandaracinaceae bacterium]|nr:hypothetical protein [Sandaracinaceae bacterium]
MGPLFAFLFLHAWETTASLSGREAFAYRFSLTAAEMTGLVVKSLLVLVPLALHAGLGLGLIARARGGNDSARYPSYGLRVLQWITGGMTAVFLVVHLSVTWAPRFGGVSAKAIYDVLMARAGTPTQLVIAGLGIASLCFHVGQGLAATCVTWGWVAGEGGLRRARIGAGLIALCFFLVFINNLSHFVAGRALAFEPSTEIHSDAIVE